ncbi:hypothetical protein PAMP_023126 [Pampus punctatissimus]
MELSERCAIWRFSNNGSDRGGRYRGIGSARYNILAIHKTLTAECSAGFTVHCKYAAIPIHSRRHDSTQYIH